MAHNRDGGSGQATLRWRHAAHFALAAASSAAAFLGLSALRVALAAGGPLSWQVSGWALLVVGLAAAAVVVVFLYRRHPAGGWRVAALAVLGSAVIGPSCWSAAPDQVGCRLVGSGHCHLTSDPWAPVVAGTTAHPHPQVVVIDWGAPKSSDVLSGVLDVARHIRQVEQPTLADSYGISGARYRGMWVAPRSPVGLVAAHPEKGISTSQLVQLVRQASRLSGTPDSAEMQWWIVPDVSPAAFAGATCSGPAWNKPLPGLAGTVVVIPADPCTHRQLLVTRHTPTCMPPTPKRPPRLGGVARGEVYAVHEFAEAAAGPTGGGWTALERCGHGQVADPCEFMPDALDGGVWTPPLLGRPPGGGPWRCVLPPSAP